MLRALTWKERREQRRLVLVGIVEGRAAHSLYSHGSPGGSFR